MSFRQCLSLIRSDLHRYYGRHSFAVFLRCMLLKPGFVYSFWMRLTAYFFRHPLWKFIFFPFSFIILRHFSFRFGIMIPFTTDIGPGLFIGHFTGIVIHPDALVGKNLNISQGVTIGQSSRGDHQGVPVIGDNVYLGPGAKVIGKIRVGSGAAVGANAVVTRDVPERAVVVGIPARVISDKGSDGYVEHVDY